MQGLPDCVLKTTEQIVIDKLDSIFANEIKNSERLFNLNRELGSYLYDVISQNINNQTLVEFDDQTIRQGIKHSMIILPLILINANIIVYIHNFDFHSKADFQRFLEVYGQKKLDEWINFYQGQVQNNNSELMLFTLCSISANKNPRREILRENGKKLINQCYQRLFYIPITQYEGDYNLIKEHINGTDESATVATLLYYSQENVLSEMKDEWRKFFLETVPTINKELLYSFPLFNALLKIEECTSRMGQIRNCICEHYTQKWGFYFITKQDLVELGNKLILLFGKTLIDPYLDFWDINEDARSLFYFLDTNFSPFKFLS